MSIFKNVFKPTVRAAESASLTIKQINTGLHGFPLIFNTDSTYATDTTALTISAFYNALDILSDYIAKLPKSVFQKKGETRNKLTSHPVSQLIGNRPHPKMS